MIANLLYRHQVANFWEHIKAKRTYSSEKKSTTTSLSPASPSSFSKSSSLLMILILPLASAILTSNWLLWQNSSCQLYSTTVGSSNCTTSTHVAANELRSNGLLWHVWQKRGWKPSVIADAESEHSATRKHNGAHGHAPIAHKNSDSIEARVLIYVLLTHALHVH